MDGDRDQWWALMNTIMNIRVKKILGNHSVTELLLTSQKGFKSMQLVNY
jgi:hypothetical protein